MLNGLFQMSHSLFKSWRTLKPHDAHAYTNTCGGFLYLRSAGPQQIVIDLCRWAVWGFLRTESGLVRGHARPHPLAATRSRYSRDARQWRPCSLISIFMVKLRFEVCWEGEKISYRSAGSSEAHVYSLVYLCRRSVPLPLVLWPHLEYKVGGSGSLQSEGVKRADKCNHLLLINFLLTQDRIQETLISFAEREGLGKRTRTGGCTFIFKFMMDVAFRHMNIYMYRGRSSTEHFSIS